MLKKLNVLATLGLGAIVAACGGDSGGSSSGPTQGSGTPNNYYFRLVNALPDGPILALQDDGVTIAGNVGYHLASVITSRSLGGSSDTIDFSIDASGPDGAPIPDLVTRQLDTQGNTEYAFVVAGQYDTPVLIVADNPRRDRPFGNLYFQFVHAASNTGGFDVYVTAPDTGLASTAPIASLAPLGYSESLEVPYEDRRIRLTTPGTLEVVFDSGTLRLSDDPNLDDDGAEWLITIADNLFPGASPVKLIISDGGFTEQVLEKAQASAVRVFHASEAFPVVDVVVGDAFNPPLASSLSYAQRTPTGLAQAGRVSLNFTAPGDPGTFVFEDTISTGVGIEHLIFLIDDDGQPASFSTAGEPRGVATEARLRLINVAPDSEFFSVFFSATDADPPDEEDRVLRDIEYTENSGYVSIEPGTYQARMTERSYEPGENPDNAEETTTVGPFEFEAAAGSVTTFVILPPGEPEGPETLEIYDDLLP